MKPINIARLSTLSTILQKDLGTIILISNSIGNLYVEEAVEKKSGKSRILHKPRYKLKLIQNNIKALLSRVTLPDCVHGWVKGKSVKSAIEPHLGMKYLYCFDIHSYFDSVRSSHVFKLLTDRLHCTPDVSKVLTKLCTCNSSLPQGSPCSPVIANLVLFDFDNSMANYAKKRNAKYTRLGDDIILSSNTKLNNAPNVVVEGLRRYGLKVNRDKYQIGVPKKSGVKVLGVVVGAGETGISISRKYRREVRAILHNAKTTGLSAQNFEGRFEWRKHLAGRIGFIEMFDPASGANLKKELDSIGDLPVKF